LFISFLVSDKLYSELEGSLGLWMVGSEIISSVMFKAGLRLVKEDNSFNVVGEVVCGSAVRVVFSASRWREIAVPNAARVTVWEA